MLAFFHPPSRSYIDPWTGEMFGTDGPGGFIHKIPNAQGHVIMPKLGNATAKCVPSAFANLGKLSGGKPGLR